MSIRSAPYYWLECDGCFRRSPAEDDEHSAWADDGQALEHAADDLYAWDVYRVDGRHLCLACTPDDEEQP